MESIIIRHFGPVQDIVIEDIKPLTILIGESGSGKSTIMKVISLFQWLYKMMCIRSYLKYSGVKKSVFRFQFDSYIKNNGMSGFLYPDTVFVYKNGSTTIEYSGKKLKGTNSYVPRDELSLEKIVYVSDKRNIIPDIYDGNAKIQKRLFYLNDTYDNYLAATDSIKEMEIDYLGVKFQVRKVGNTVRHQIVSSNTDEKYSINLNDASSGTKNVIPLELIVEYFAKYYDLVDSMNHSIFSYVSKADSLKDFKATTNIGEFPVKRVSILLEEPELSLYPDYQLRLMDFLVNRCFVSHSKEYEMSLILATHSPYIVNYLNVLINRPKIDEHDAAYIDAGSLAVYRVFDGNVQNLMARDSSGDSVVNTYDLSEPMKNIMDEYQSLRRNVRMD
ncbi:MAG: AAA family ATPase [Prevotella sp.]|nr:AAA family ATPase [Prevotella sp.]MDY4626428.1 AAA family ATPase [Prevotella sp.]MDY4666944.1 AAA family ATPase [Prevotella sp.]MDY5259013.1 AAA family ATPase [Prevotella sp.]